MSGDEAWLAFQKYGSFQRCCTELQGQGSLQTKLGELFLSGPCFVYRQIITLKQEGKYPKPGGRQEREGVIMTLRVYILLIMDFFEC